MKALCLVVLSLISCVGFSQGLVKGAVLDANESPIAGASIVFEGTTVSTVSGALGDFSLQIPAKKGIVNVSYLGKQTKQVAVVLDGEKNVDLGNIRLNNIGLEKSIIGVQFGTGVNIYNEFKLTERLVLRSEIDFSPLPLIASNIVTYYDGNGVSLGTDWLTDFLLLPQNTSVELRSYLTIGKRGEKNLRITSNAAEFLSIGLKYAPGYIGISQADMYNTSVGSVYGLDGMLISMISLGTRRSFSEKMNVELKAGVGLNLNEVFSEPTPFGFVENWQDVYFYPLQGLAYQLSLKIGYDFFIKR